MTGCRTRQVQQAVAREPSGKSNVEAGNPQDKNECSALGRVGARQRTWLRGHEVGEAAGAPGTLKQGTSMARGQRQGSCRAN